VRNPSTNRSKLTQGTDAKLTLALHDDTLMRVQRLSVREAMNEPFVIRVRAISDDEDIDLESIVGKGFVLTVTTPSSGSEEAARRSWSGVCAEMGEVHAEEVRGKSIYELVLVPALWRTKLRTNCRIYQHMTTPDIVDKLLVEWDIKATRRLHAEYRRHEYIVQYNETDFAFLSRLLEDAGISYYFENAPDETKGRRITTLVFADAPHANEPRKAPLGYTPHRAHLFGADVDKDLASRVVLGQKLALGRFTLRGHDFRARSDMPVNAAHHMDTEENYEHYEYLGPGFSRWSDQGVGDTPTADARGSVRVDHKKAPGIVEQRGRGHRRERRVVTFETNALDIAPGTVCAINQGSSGANHPRSDLGPDKKLLVVGSSIEWARDEDWAITARAVFASSPHVPERRTPKPRIFGLQSAVVTGPPGEEIHVDEWGRVSVQFPWDREGKYDHHSSCWIRVSQAWAGGGFGFAIHPRVGWEALVAYYEGDPDLPIIVGFVHNATTRVPHLLPENKDSSRWRSNTYPGGAGYNEIHFKDTSGAEEFNLQAQKDHTRVVNNDMTSHVGNDKTSYVGSNHTQQIGMDSLLSAGGSILSNAAEIHRMLVGNSTGVVLRKDRVIVLSTGGASIKLAGDNIDINATGNICLHAGKELHISSNKGTVRVQGGKHVLINEHERGPEVRPDQPIAASSPGSPLAGGTLGPPFLPSALASLVKLPGPFAEVTQAVGAIEGLVKGKS
jgi:type VI secretion system secreted protein VgrG